MSSGSDFSGDDDFFDDNLFLTDPACDQSMSNTSFVSSGSSWDPMDLHNSDDNYNEISDIEDLEYASHDSTISRDPEIRLPIVDPTSKFKFVAPTRDVKPSPIFPFTGEPVGYSNNIPIFDSPTDAFQSIIDEEVVESIVFWTNERAEKYFEGRPNTKLNGIKW